MAFPKNGEPETRMTCRKQGWSVKIVTFETPQTTHDGQCVNIIGLSSPLSQLCSHLEWGLRCLSL